MTQSMQWPTWCQCALHPHIASFNSITGWCNGHVDATNATTHSHHLSVPLQADIWSVVINNAIIHTHNLSAPFRHKPNHVPSMHMACITPSNNFTWLKPKISHIHSHQNYSFSQDSSKLLSCINWHKIPLDRWVNLTQTSLNHIFP